MYKWLLKDSVHRMYMDDPFSVIKTTFEQYAYVYTVSGF